MTTKSTTYRPDTINRYADDRYNSRNSYKAQASPFDNVSVIYLYQYVDDISIGTGYDADGNPYEMVVPIAIDRYYSKEFGGVESAYKMSDWKSINKQLTLRGYNYLGKEYNRTSKEGREFGEYLSNILCDIEKSVNLYFSGAPNGEPQIVRVTPTWAWFSLILMVASMLLLVLTVVH